jgi:protein tyrosine/serine phosphatase
MTSDFPKSSAPKRRLLYVAALLILIGMGSALVWHEYFSTYHLATVQPGVLYRDGAVSLRQFQRALDQVQPKMVVCLVDDREFANPTDSHFRDEFALLRKRGIRTQRLPVPLGGWPTSDDVQLFLDITTVNSNQPVLVHCAQGVRRTAMMVAAYQESVLGYDKQRARDSILTFGHSDKTINDIKRFIDGYDPKTRTVSSELATVDQSGK